MKRFRITVDGRTFDIEMLSDPRQDRVEVVVDGEPLTVEVDVVAPLGSEGVPPRAAAVPVLPVGVAFSSSSVRAPLPGVVKSVTVHAGEKVARGDKLLVIEAMKMNNLIRASREGVIAAVHVAQGRQVAYGELLLEYQD